MVKLSELRELLARKDAGELKFTPTEEQALVEARRWEDAVKLPESFAAAAKIADLARLAPGLDEALRPSRAMADMMRRMDAHTSVVRHMDRLTEPLRRIQEQSRGFEEIARSVSAFQSPLDRLGDLLPTKLGLGAQAFQSMQSLERSQRPPEVTPEPPRLPAIDFKALRSPMVDGIERVETALVDLAVGIEKLQETTVDIANRGAELADARERREQENVLALRADVKELGSKVETLAVKQVDEARKRERRAGIQSWVQILVSAVVGGLIGAIATKLLA